MSVKQISSDEIEIGMYVSSLDRPWLETPFMFQGFIVQDQQEIDELIRLTKFVYILVPDDVIKLEKPTLQGQSSKSANNLKKNIYKRISAVDEEIEQIRSSHEIFSESLSDMEKLIKEGASIRLDLIEEPIKIMVKSVSKNPDAYLWLSRLRKFDSFLYKDSLMSAVLSASLGRRLGLEENELQVLSAACLLMDIGKLALPTELIHKSDRLTEEEWELMKTHVQLGVDILSSSSNYKPQIIDIVRTHHERIDGSGYPEGLNGTDIPLFGQIAGIVDQYVAVTNPRPYAEVISHSKAQAMLFNQKGSYFDEMLVEYFIQTLSTYPTGTLVELSTGEVAIVKAQKSSARLKPDVIMLLNNNKEPYGSYMVVSLDNYSVGNMPVTISSTLANGTYGIQIEELSI
jgi:HD-GYP domain-containing protein (c-di-GMP phosphodiesterase class II)